MAYYGAYSYPQPVRYCLFLTEDDYDEFSLDIHEFINTEGDASDPRWCEISDNCRIYRGGFTSDLGVSFSFRHHESAVLFRLKFGGEPFSA